MSNSVTCADLCFYLDRSERLKRLNNSKINLSKRYRGFRVEHTKKTAFVRQSIQFLHSWRWLKIAFAKYRMRVLVFQSALSCGDSNTWQNGMIWISRFETIKLKKKWINIYDIAVVTMGTCANFGYVLYNLYFLLLLRSFFFQPKLFFCVFSFSLSFSLPRCFCLFAAVSSSFVVHFISAARRSYVCVWVYLSLRMCTNGEYTAASFYHD